MPESAIAANGARTCVMTGFNFIKDTFNLILPGKCDICGKLSDANERFTSYDETYRMIYGKNHKLNVCGKCLSALAPNDSDRRWFLCLSNPYEDDPHAGLALYMPFPYKGIVHRALPGIKFGKKIEPARLFGIMLGTCMAEDNVGVDIMTSVPLSEERLKERGFNQAEEIAYPASVIAGIPYKGGILQRVRNTMRQTEMEDNHQRISNVTGAFKVSEDWDVNGLTVAVTDDVSTTGFTLHEAASALYEAGAAKVLCVAFAGNRQVKNAEAF